MKKDYAVNTVEIAIILSTYNGAKYIREQLDSIISQSHDNWRLFIRDDSSGDTTVEILKEYKSKYPEKVNIVFDSLGNIGAKNSYTELIKCVRDVDYVAFSDQDDVWDPQKIETLLIKMKETEGRENYPAAVFSDLEIVDEYLNPVSNSFYSYTKLSPNIVYSNVLLFRNVVPGCSMMINKKLASYINVIPDDAVMHDYWIILAAHFLGKISYVNLPLVKYRQHDRNALGAEKHSDKNIISILKLFLLALRKKIFYLQNFLVYIKQLAAFYRLYGDRINDSKTIQAVINLPDQKSFLKRKFIALKYGLGYGNWLMNLEFILCC